MKRGLLGAVVFLVALGLALFVLPDPKAGADPGLVPFGSCDELLAYMKTALKDSYSYVGPVAEDGMLPSGAGEAPAAREETDAAAADPGTAPSAETPEQSSTNVQEAGIDEGDVVETDGQRLFVLSGGELRSIDVTGGTPRLVGTLRLEDGEGNTGDGQLLLDSDRLVVVSETYDTADGTARVRVRAVGIDASGQMTPAGESSIDGNLVSTRGIDGSVTVVTSHSPQPPPPVMPDASDTSFDYEEARRRAIKELDLEDLLPQVTTTAGGESSTHDLVTCRQVHRPPEPSGPTLTNVVTIGPDSTDPVDAETVVADGQIVYASEGAVYVAAGTWPGGMAPAAAEESPSEGGVETAVHRFDRTQAGVAYYGSGRVRGRLLNQFAMSEHEGFLRVASTDDDGTTNPDGTTGPASESLVTVLEPRADRLEPVGELAGLGPTERIYSVRFMGDRAFVVTFRQTDPLYTLDLSDPTSPRTTGELEITGFSAYLHPISEDRLLGIGQDATESGQQLGTQVSLFDVADPASPRRLAQWAAGNWSHSEAEYDHHAFLYWAPRNLALLPVDASVVGLEVGADAITQVGTIEHPAPAECPEPLPEERVTPPDVAPGVAEDVVAPEPACDGYGTAIRRSVVVGNHVYTVGDTGVMATDLATFQPAGWLAF
ncbi:MAG: beta-propeller domain-containing protein [Acidimicrobiia bacterium]|nr:beta-propeller domain-containing protein [Acidimicrobiia bacterium]